MPQPSSIISEAMVRPMSVFGVISPKPTVVMVLMAQYIDVGMLLKPLSGPSTTYITVPNRKTTIMTKDKKMRILRRLASKARPSTVYSCTYDVSLRIRNMRSRRKIRTSISTCAPGSSKPM